MNKEIFKDLFEKQKRLDEFILSNNEKIDKETFEKNSILALLVEVAELANETRVFKHWSKKGASAKEVILEEFADCMHFLLAIGNLNDRYKTEVYKEKVFYWDVPKTLKSTQQLFIDLYKAIIDFEIYKSDITYAEVWARLLELGKRLHFTEKDMLNGYEEKNKINYERQRNGY